MSKKLIHFTFALLTIVGVTAISSCKKGENDPLISLKSRKARITGVWKLQEGVITNTTSSSLGTFTSTTTYNESSETNNNGSSSPYTESLTIEKDGTFTVDVVEDGNTFSISGAWFFAGAIKDQDLKNKEAIVLNAQQFTEPGYAETFDGFYYGEVLIIDQLKNKEIIFKGKTTSSWSLGSGGSYSYDKTYAKQ